jgi:hypothetical protein
MRKTFLAVTVFGLLIFGVPQAHAQLFEALGNPNVVAGGSFLIDQPASGTNRASFMLSANIAGVKLGALPVYVGGVGVALPSEVDAIASQFGNYFMVSVPAVTWYPNAGKVLVQAGYAYALSDAVQSRNSFYVGVGYAWNSPAYLQYKRDAKRAKAAGKPLPPNPYDAK